MADKVTPADPRDGLLPLPESFACTAGARRDCWTADQMHDYAIACIEADRLAHARPEAVDGVLWRIENEAGQFIDENGMIYLRYLGELLKSTAAQHDSQQEAAVGDGARDALRTIDLAIEVLEDRQRPAMAESLEGARRVLAATLTPDQSP